MANENLLSIIETFPVQLRNSVLQWLEWDKNPKTLNEIVKLVEERNEPKLSERLLQRQLFGTAGIRGFMEAGNNGLNDLVVIQTTQGLAKYLLNVNREKATQSGVVIGYDGRYNSSRFARLAARVCLSAGIPVNLFSKIVPTPFVAYGVRLLSCAAGIMVTASHNPKEYNGYKVYFDNGAQILPPHDENIQKCIMKNLQPWNSEIWNVESLSYDTEARLCDPLKEVGSEYYKALKLSATQLDLVSKTDLRAVYTPLHGVGHEYLTHAFRTIGFKNYYPVLSQKDPDPEFSTVVFPNPEEGKGVLDESIKTATQSGATLIIANDPDSDRCAIAELNQSTGEWRALNGNEIGALFGWWTWKQRSPDIPAKDCFMVSSAVSSKILETYARKEGFNWQETLTGFKWMSNLADDLQSIGGKHVLFAFEEAIGFMIGTNVLDKDGISAASVVIQMASYLRARDQTLVGQLNEIYSNYGYHYSINSYYICHDSEKISRIFNRVADLNGPSSYITEVAGVKVVRIRDLNRGYDSSTNDKLPLLPTSSSSFMLTLYLENGSVITFRTSGTEPKIKYYSEIIADPSEKNWKLVEEKHRQIIEAAVQLVLEPEKNVLLPKKD